MITDVQDAVKKMLIKMVSYVQTVRLEETYGWYLHHRGLYRYNEAMKEYMQRYKFNRRLSFMRGISA